MCRKQKQKRDDKVFCRLRLLTAENEKSQCAHEREQDEHLAVGRIFQRAQRFVSHPAASRFLGSETASHQLTAFGYLSLLSEQQDITMDAHRAMADGVVTAEERRRIDIKLDRASARIQRLTRKAAKAAEPK